ncbi:MAG: GntR family transcriptional regulator [Pseudomonas sp.]
MELKTSPQDIYQALKSMITSLEITPGSRVTESQLATYFHVSRTPIRAALQRLESEGLLNVMPKQGCFIRNIDILQISHYYDVRVALENLVLEEVSRLQDHSGLKALAEIWRPDLQTFGIELTDALKEAEENFHLDLARLSGNQALVGYIEDINAHIHVVRRLGWPDSKSIIDTYEEHHLICELLLARDLAAAQFEMTNHIRKSQDGANRVTLKQLYANPKAVKFE